MGEKRTRAKYTLEFKMEAVRLVINGQLSADVAKILGVPKDSLENWILLDDNGSLTSGKDKVISHEQMDLARRRAELVRVKMERDILKKATACVL
jgi:transposase-like protein